MILVSLRGVGKTVLLNRVQQMAEESSSLSIFVGAHEGKRLPELLLPGLRNALYKLSFTDGAKEKARRGLRVLKRFLSGVKISMGDIDVGVDPEIGTADTGDLETDLPELMLATAAASKDAGRPIAILVDELQYLTTDECSALIMSVHRINQRNLPLIVIDAGLPQILALSGASKSYAERLFRYPKVGALDRDDAVSAIKHPAESEGVTFEEEAITEILRVAQRYPYFLQQWVYEAWNVSPTATITADIIPKASKAAIEELDQSFFKVRFDRCTPSEKRYMRALSELGSGTQRSSDIAEMLNVKSTSVAPMRNALIKKDMIYSPSHGDTAFTVPLFDEYMKRAMTDLK